MKNSILRFAAVIISLLFVTLFASCGGDGENGDGNGGVTVRKIENIGDYAIVRSGEASGAITKAASDLSADFFRETDVKVVSITDEKKEIKHEIIIGETLRSTDVDHGALGLGEYIIKLSGDKIIIAGGSDMATVEAIKFFRENLVTADGVRVPTGEGYSYKNENIFHSIKIDGVSIEDYTIVQNLYDGAVAQSFADQVKKAAYCELPITDGDSIDEAEGKCIYFDDTNTDFTKYSVKIEDGNVIFFGNHATMADCVSYFFTELLGYDTEKGEITGELSAELKSGDGKDFVLEKKTPYTKEKLMSVLEEVYNDDERIIIGQQMSERNGVTMETERALYTENCGVDAAMYGYDLGTMESDYKSTENARVKEAYDMIEYIREGGILTFSAHFKNPAGLPENESAYRGELGHEDKWDELMTEGTELNANFMETLSNVTDFLEIFHKNGATLIFRPLHEMNGNWFWFCIVNGEDNHLLPEEYAQRLWRLIYDYIVVERGIDNLIWEYGPNVSRGTSGSMASVMYCYPGDEYCDLVAADWYTGEYSGHEMLSIAAEEMKETGKIFSVSEFGPGEQIRTDFSVSESYGFGCTDLDRLIIECVDDGIKTAYWLLWSSWAEVKISMWNMGDANLFYDNEMYLTLDDTVKLLYD